MENFHDLAWFFYLNSFCIDLILPRMKIIIFEFLVLIKYFLFIISILGILVLAHRKNLIQAIEQCTFFIYFQGCSSPTTWYSSPPLFFKSWFSSPSGSRKKVLLDGTAIKKNFFCGFRTTLSHFISFPTALLL